MHRTLKQATASPAQSDLKKQRDCFERFRTKYNELRPHPQSLQGQTPSETHSMPLRLMPSKLSPIEPGLFCCSESEKQ
ncbi:MAG: transposase [Myxococcaceae bacterium]|nr:transposase [Myxococcaceae bacterium]